MPIRVTCLSCRKIGSAPDEAVGRTVRCPSCGASTKVPIPTPDFLPVGPPDDPPIAQAVDIRVGVAHSPWADLHFTFVVKPDGSYVQLAAFDSTSPRKSPIIFRLDEDGWKGLRELVAATDATIARLRAKRQAGPLMRLP